MFDLSTYNEVYFFLSNKVLYGDVKEHSNIPVDDAIKFIYKDYVTNYRSINARQHPEAILSLLQILQVNRCLRLSQYNRIISYLKHCRYVSIHSGTKIFLYVDYHSIHSILDSSEVDFVNGTLSTSSSPSLSETEILGQDEDKLFQTSLVQDIIKLSDGFNNSQLNDYSELMNPCVLKLQSLLVRQDLIATNFAEYKEISEGLKVIVDAMQWTIQNCDAGLNVDYRM